MLHRRAGVPLLVGRHHIPWGVLGVGALDGDLEGLHILRPELALAHVAGVVFPVLFGGVEPRLKPFGLLLGRNMQHDLDDPRSILGEAPFKIDDRSVAALDLLGRGKGPHALNEHVLVVGAVENSDDAGAGHALLDAPEEIVGTFLGGRGLERGKQKAVGLHLCKHEIDDSALARRIHCLEHDEQPIMILRIHPALRVQLLLQLAQLRRGACQFLLARGLVPFRPGRGGRFDVG